MPHRQPFNRALPKTWLMTDPRLDDCLLAAIRALPRGSGVVFRHYALPHPARRALFAQVRRVCAQRGHLLLLAGGDGRGWHADGHHGFAHPSLRTAPVHNWREIRAAKRADIDLLFLSPVYATNTHPDARPMGVAQFMRLARLAKPASVIALGGMNRARAQMLDKQLVHGWAAIDAFKR
jgi:thiamine-phosphate pyrophosphorylase